MTEQLRTCHHRFHLQLVQLPRSRPGRHSAGKISAQYPPDPPDVLRAAGSDLRAQGTGERRRWGADHRLPPGRMPLHGAELQSPAALPAPAAHAGADGHRAGTRSSWLGQRRGRRQAGQEITKLVEEIRSSGSAAAGPSYWLKTVTPAEIQLAVEEVTA